MKQEPGRVIWDVSWTALLKLLGFSVAIWAIITLRNVWILLFGVFIFVAAVNPIIKKWQRHMSRVLAVSLFYALLVAIIAIISSVFIPQLVKQVNDLIHTLPGLVSQLSPYLSGLREPSGISVADQLSQSARNALDTISRGLLNSTVVVISSLATFLTGAVLSFYLLLEENNARIFFHQVLPHNRFEAVYKTVSKISDRMGSWVRGQIILMLVIALADLILYLVLGLSSPLPLAIWAGLCEIIPYIGPTLGIVPAVLLALSTGNILKAVVILLINYGVIQQLESHVLVPKIMSKALGLSPVLVIIALTIGVELLGLVGALIAVPVAAVISVVVGEWPELRKIWEGNAS
ncbi:AI-2E family transporter [Patescibacteria group bacterium]|nr:AI-2E family transporter [Patescibacteria group bacterium]